MHIHTHTDIHTHHTHTQQVIRVDFFPMFKGKEGKSQMIAVCSLPHSSSSGAFWLVDTNRIPPRDRDRLNVTLQILYRVITIREAAAGVLDHQGPRPPHSLAPWEAVMN